MRAGAVLHLWLYMQRRGRLRCHEPCVNRTHAQVCIPRSFSRASYLVVVDRARHAAGAAQSLRESSACGVRCSMHSGRPVAPPLHVCPLCLAQVPFHRPSCVICTLIEAWQHRRGRGWR